MHHPNPNEVSTLGKIIESYRISILLSTPTFMANIVRANADNDLESLRLCVTGAEKCPREVYEALRTRCPEAVILEGYGITECSPVVAVVREDDIQPGTIGKPLPSVRALVRIWKAAGPRRPVGRECCWFEGRASSAVISTTTAPRPSRPPRVKPGTAPAIWSKPTPKDD
jgi:long-chain-fatty-acid--[acyl-carrier-protein] ligase